MLPLPVAAVHVNKANKVLQAELDTQLKLVQALTDQQKELEVQVTTSKVELETCKAAQGEQSTVDELGRMINALQADLDHKDRQLQIYKVIIPVLLLLFGDAGTMLVDYRSPIRNQPTFGGLQANSPPCLVPLLRYNLPLACSLPAPGGWREGGQC